MRKWLVILIIVIIGVIGYNYVYQNHRDVSSEVPEFELSVDAIHNEFINNPKSTETRYLNKTIVLSGMVTESSNDDFSLNSKAFCQLSESLKTPLSENSSITVKGRLIGYDELLEQVKLDQCTLIEY